MFPFARGRAARERVAAGESFGSRPRGSRPSAQQPNPVDGVIRAAARRAPELLVPGGTCRRSRVANAIISRLPRESAQCRKRRRLSCARASGVWPGFPALFPIIDIVISMPPTPLPLAQQTRLPHCRVAELRQLGHVQDAAACKSRPSADTLAVHTTCRSFSKRAVPIECELSPSAK